MSHLMSIYCAMRPKEVELDALCNRAQDPLRARPTAANVLASLLVAETDLGEDANEEAIFDTTLLQPMLSNLR